MSSSCSLHTDGVMFPSTITSEVLNIGWSIRIFILMTGRNVEQTKDVRMYIEEFILVEIWIHCCTKLN